MKKKTDPRMHSAEHILNQTMDRMFGCGRCFSAHIERRKSKCDYHFDRGLTAEEIAEIQDRVNRDRESHGGKVRDRLDRFERRLYRRQRAVEQKALALCDRDPATARDYLTAYSYRVAQRAAREARRLARRIERDCGAAGTRANR